MRHRNKNEATHRATWIIALASLFLLAANVNGQTVAPISGLGNVQFFDNNGAVLTNGVLYSFQAGTSTQQATYTDSSGLIQNPNPIPFGSGARVQIWLSIGSFYKLVLCSQNDGAACAAGDILFTVDNVPGGSTSSGGSSSSPFISGTANPATSGILRLASGDTVCWRNAAGSTNLCFSKDANDALSWPTALKLPEISAPSCSVGFAYLWADSTSHALKECANGASPVQLVGTGTDINGGGFIVGLHFGATSTPLSGTAPTTNQFLTWNGSNIVGGSPENVMLGVTVAGNTTPTCTAAQTSCNFYIFANAHTLTRIVLNIVTAPSGCSTNAQYGVRDMTAASTLASVTPTATGILDSGALAVSMPAGHQYAIGITTTSVGCVGNVVPGQFISAVYQ